MRRHKAFCSIAQKIIHKVNHWHLFKDFYKRVFQDEHIGHSLRPWEGLRSEVYLWGECLWQRSLLNLGLAAAKSLQLCPTLCDPTDGSPPGTTVPGILQVRTLEWIAISFSNAGKWKVKVKSQSSPTLSDPMDCSPPGSSIHGIFQTKVLEWGAIAFSLNGVNWMLNK